MAKKLVFSFAVFWNIEYYEQCGSPLEFLPYCCFWLQNSRQLLFFFTTPNRASTYNITLINGNCLQNRNHSLELCNWLVSCWTGLCKASKGHFSLTKDWSKCFLKSPRWKVPQAYKQWSSIIVAFVHSEKPLFLTLQLVKADQPCLFSLKCWDGVNNIRTKKHLVKE